MPPPSHDFLQLCLRAHCTPNARDLLAPFVQRTDLDWQEVLALTAAQRLGPVVYAVMRDTGLVPAAVQGVLRDSYYATAQRNLLRWHDLAAVLRALAAAGIRVMLLKGVPLAETAYRNIALRPMADVDLLIDHAQLRKVIEILGGLGYVPPTIEMRAGTIATYENEIPLCNSGGAELDIHWGLFDSPLHQHAVSMEWFWQTARPLHIDDVPALMLGPEAMLLHLCGHVWLHHAGTPLLWLHDVALTLAVERRVDWEELLHRAALYHLVMPTQRVLCRIADEWAVPLPPDVLLRLRTLQPASEETRTVRLLTAAQRPAAQRLWADLRGMPGWRRRLRFASILLFPSPRYMRARYRIRHALLLPLYYAHRWIRGIRGA